MEVRGYLQVDHRPRSNTLPSDLARKLKQGRIELARARQENAAKSDTQSSSPIPVIFYPDEPSPRYSCTHQKSHVQAEIVRRFRHVDGDVATRFSPPASPRTRRHRKDQSPSRSRDQSPKTQRSPRRNDVIMDTLQLPDVNPMRKSVSNESLQSQSSDTMEYLDECMRSLSNEALAVSRDPLPRGSRAYETALHSLGDQKKPVVPRMNDLRVDNCRVRASKSAPNSPNSTRRVRFKCS